MLMKSVVVLLVRVSCFCMIIMVANKWIGTNVRRYLLDHPFNCCYQRFLYLSYAVGLCPFHSSSTSYEIYGVTRVHADRMRGNKI